MALYLNMDTFGHAFVLFTIPTSVTSFEEEKQYALLGG